MDNGRLLNMENKQEEKSLANIEPTERPAIRIDGGIINKVIKEIKSKTIAGRVLRQK